MSKDANPGELRVKIIVEAFTEGESKNGFRVLNWFNVFGLDDHGIDKFLKVKWVNLHGSGAWEAMSLQLKEPATLTSRFSPLITETCRILKKSDVVKRDELIAEGKQDEADGLYFEVISLDDVENRHEWLEIRVQRKVSAT